jgi:hypothetical protein
MRSLWRRLASRWLGGGGSEALAGDATALDMLLSGERHPQVFDVHRVPGVSHHAMMSSAAENGSDLQIVSEEVLCSDPSDRDLC